MSTHPTNSREQSPAGGKRRTVGKDELQELIEPVCVDCGFELVDIEYGQSLLRVYIDYPEGSDKNISFEECERLSHELSAILDVEDMIAGKYHLEVSSPGIDRPLRTAAHFARCVGETVKIAMSEGLDGRRNFKGELVKVNVDQEHVTVDVDGTHFELPLADLASARLVPNWDALMKGKGKKA